MNTDAELLLREGLDRLTAGAQVRAGMASRVLARRRRRRAAGYGTAVAAAAAITAVVVAAATGGLAGPAATARARGAAARPQVPHWPAPTWSAGCRTRSPTAPANACTIAGFLDAPGDPGTNWPSLIVRTLACGGYKMAGYADIGGAKTVKMTGSRVLGTGSGTAGESTNTVTLFVSPSTYLPVRITCSTAAPGLHGSRTSADIQWLPPTMTNRAHASVTVPCGYQQISWPSGKPTSGEPGGACG